MGMFSKQSLASTYPSAMNLSTFQIIELGILTTTTCFHAIASFIETSQDPAPGTITKAGNHRLHWYEQGSGTVTIIVDSSLGGAEGYLVIDRLATLGRVIVYDRPGYGWSPSSWRSRTSQQINKELKALLQAAQIQPPYILVGDSFGSYNMRLFAHSYLEQVMGLVMTDGLHEEAMLSLPLRLGLLKLFFTISFGFVGVGAMLGIVRVLGMLGLFEKIKPELTRCSPTRLKQVKRSFYRASHWWTMAREMIGLDASGRQLRAANALGRLPVMNIKAGTFLKLPGDPILWNWLIHKADQTRDRIHIALAKVGSETQQFSSLDSSHFIWVDQPEIIVAAVEQVIDRLQRIPDEAEESTKIQM
jgi:pimeloyl-ACP methyl ester carboxylesterase